ncbi:hypothetical protein ACVIGB_000248 [Bradyrhizobium sp. USDA 4341]
MRNRTEARHYCAFGAYLHGALRSPARNLSRICDHNEQITSKEDEARSPGKLDIESDKRIRLPRVQAEEYPGSRWPISSV